MSKLSASDRSALIKLASSLPSGSPERRAILAGLQQKKASDLPVGVQSLLTDLERINGVSSATITDSWRDGYYQISVSIEPKEGKNELGGWSGKIVSLSTRANAPYGKFYNLPDYRKIAFAVRALVSRSGLRVENMSGPSKVYEFQDRISKMRGEPRLSAYDGNKIVIQLYA
jgi:hypothetical protein